MTNDHANPTTDGEDMVIAVSGSNQAARILGHINYQQVGYGLEAPLRRFQTHLYSGKSVEKWVRTAQGNLGCLNCFHLAIFRRVSLLSQ
jgi:hypothetical protein